MTVFPVMPQVENECQLQTTLATSTDVYQDVKIEGSKFLFVPNVILHIIYNTTSGIIFLFITGSFEDSLFFKIYVFRCC
ncbi:hypothetical protein L596_017435 [Steinernema carpocapsae]|uniref:Uncharacterized protein n=1 Tax=Steinernema carpocapsae TaxID=34508 RepID=A0A4V6A1T1_STECR|nr:hypothetical protein L596_017435 [Steinernema carpocapsae]